MLERLIASVYSALDKSPNQQIALRIRHPDGVKWSIKRRVLTLGTESGATIGTVNLLDMDISALSKWCAAHGLTVAYLNPAMQHRCAAVLLSGASSQSKSNGDALWAYDSLLWSILDAYAVELEDAEFNIDEAIKQMYLTTAEGEWLDFWGEIFGIPRDLLSDDADYRKYIVEETLRKRSNVIAIEDAVYQSTGARIGIREMWREIYRLDSSTLSGSHHMQDGNFYTWNVIQPYFLSVTTAWVRSRMEEIIRRNKPAGTLVVNPWAYMQVAAVECNLQPTVSMGVVGLYGMNIKVAPGGTLDGTLRFSDGIWDLPDEISNTTIVGISAELSPSFSGMFGQSVGSVRMLVDVPVPEFGNVKVIGDSVIATKAVPYSWIEGEKWGDFAWGDASSKMLITSLES